MQIMADKGLVRREESGRAHIYTPRLRKEDTQGQLIEDLMDKVFGGSAAQLVIRALENRKATKEELDEIRRMIDEHEGSAQ